MLELNPEQQRHYVTLPEGECPCATWLTEYNRQGNKAFYDAEIAHEASTGSFRFHICASCKISTDGHGDWCEYCSMSGGSKC